MKLGILEAGSPPEPLSGQFGSYSNMFRRLLGPAFEFKIFNVQEFELPDADDDCQAYLITGSSAGVYDADAWIRSLEDFVRQKVGSAPIIGICFGHQLMAQALGGQVVKSEKGWGIGLHQYEILIKEQWMSSFDPVHLPASHQDQVVALGPRARVLAGSAFTPFAIIDYPGLNALSIQAHPEFEPDFATALIEARRGENFDVATADAAIQSLKDANDRQRIAVWIRRHLSGR